MNEKKVVLAFSGGLDTTYCCLYLKNTLKLQVHAVLINTGGFTGSEINTIKDHAHRLGVHTFTCIDIQQEFYDDAIRYLLFGNVLKNQTYPLSVSAERVFQAKAVAHYAQQIHADCLAHGSTGAGNDQVRFDMIFRIVCPEMEIITPIRDQGLSREQEIDYLKEHHVDFDFEKAEYSINKGIWGTSVGGKETLNSRSALPEQAFPTALTGQSPKELTIGFSQGEVIEVDGHHFSHPVEGIKYLQQVAGPYGIGRDIHVGDTIIGIKGRVGFEAAAAIILIKAHHLLEKHTLTKYQLQWKDQLSAFYGTHLHEGMYLDPVMRNIESFLTDSQKTVNGTVFITLWPYRFLLHGIQSDNDLMADKFGSYGEINRAWTGDDVKGFARIMANQMAIFHSVNPLYASKARLDNSPHAHEQGR